MTVADKPMVIQPPGLDQQELPFPSLGNVKPASIPISGTNPVMGKGTRSVSKGSGAKGKSKGASNNGGKGSGRGHSDRKEYKARLYAIKKADEATRRAALSQDERDAEDLLLQRAKEVAAARRDTMRQQREDAITDEQREITRLAQLKRQRTAMAKKRKRDKEARDAADVT